MFAFYIYVCVCVYELKCLCDFSWCCSRLLYDYLGFFIEVVKCECLWVYECEYYIWVLMLTQPTAMSVSYVCLSSCLSVCLCVLLSVSISVCLPASFCLSNDAVHIAWNKLKIPILFGILDACPVDSSRVSLFWILESLNPCFVVSLYRCLVRQLLHVFILKFQKALNLSLNVMKWISICANEPKPTTAKPFLSSPLSSLLSQSQSHSWPTAPGYQFDQQSRALRHV